MTLIQCLVASEKVIAVSSDTRNVLMFGEKVVKEWKSGEDKILPLSSYCIYAGGGDNNFYKHVGQELLKRELKYLDDYHYAFEKIITGMKKSEMFQDDMKDDEFAQMFIVGFNRAGKPGVVNYSTGGEVEMIEINLYPKLFLIAPSEDEARAAFGAFQSSHYSDNDVVNAISNMSGLHAAFHANDKSTVSEEFMYCALDNSEEGLMRYQDKITLIRGE